MVSMVASGYHPNPMKSRGNASRTHKEAIVDEFDTLEKMLAEGKQDWLKWKGGNKTAGTRVRKLMQEVKAQAQAIREKVLDSREGEAEKQG